MATEVTPDDLLPVPDDAVPTATLLRASLDVALANAPGPLVLAVSGGRDSMALLHAMARWAPERLAAVATYDHATGGYATDAAALVAAEARKLGLTVVRERARVAGVSEAAWRSGRWSFLHRVARAYRGRIATAHTRDDQVETVVMRLLRGAGARGLAALAAPSPVVRPWLAVSRAEVAAWARAEALQYLEDPTNATLHFLRGRMRHDLLPVLEAAHPGFADEMLRVGDQAARWRQEVEAFVDALPIVSLGATRLQLPTRPLVQTTDEGRAVLWAALFGRVGVAIDAHGTRALVRFTDGDRIGAYLSIAGGATVIRRRIEQMDVFEVRGPSVGAVAPTVVTSASTAALPARWGRWRFREAGGSSGAVSRNTAEERSQSAWHCPVPSQAPLTVRAWNPGDRIRTAGARAGRRVTRYFAEAGVPALDRPGWPVVLQAEEIVWVPGVCRSVAAPNRPGRSDLIWYRCERERD